MARSAFTSLRAQHHLSREEDGTGREEVRVQSTAGHNSVLKKEVVEYLVPQESDVILDATAGMGGHSEALLEAGAGKVIAIDADPRAVDAARERLSRFGNRAVVLQGNFNNIPAVLHEAGIEKITKAVFDLGWNMTQLSSGRGFSFQKDEPLFMSYGERPASGFSAAEIVNTWSEKVLADVFFGYGEERYARRIAKKIVEAREQRPILTTFALTNLIKSAVPATYRNGRLHPSTRSFQALRIAVNDELQSLEKGIAAAWDVLTPGGRMAVISFHSIEDRVVKRAFADFAKGGGTLLIKKPLVPSKKEVAENPPSRSAKLRVIEKQ
jgi:16S rRNA (cytosine1402-N4)-methyltransferase